MAEIVWTKGANEDLQSIYEYIAKESAFHADKFIDKLISRLNILVNQPRAGRIVAEFENELVRELIEGNYRIIYKIESFNEVAVMRIHHSSRLLRYLS